LVLLLEHHAVTADLTETTEERDAERLSHVQLERARNRQWGWPWDSDPGRSDQRYLYVT
jgi:hypothetical protein